MRCVVLSVALLAAPAVAAPVVFDRVDPVEVRTGVMRQRTVEAPLLEMPGMEKHRTTWRETRFSRLYAIDFQLETRRRNAVELENRGTLYVAVRTDLDALMGLDERLHALLASLGPDAFVARLAGIHEMDSRFLGLAEISLEPSWICSSGGGNPRSYAGFFQTQAETRPDGTTRTIGSSFSNTAEAEDCARVCANFQAAAQAATPEEIRTLPAPRELHELRVELEEASTLPRELRPDELPVLPRGVEISRRKSPGATRGGSISPDLSRGTRIEQGIEWVASTVPAELSPDLLARGAYVSRWTLRERDRRLGARSKDEVRTAAVRTVAYLPIAPPLLPDESLPPTIPVELNAELLREDVSQEFDVLSEVDAKALEWALLGGGTSDPEWLRSEGWMMVVCRDDGTAWFALPPTSAQSSVTNAAVFCAAMERMLT